MFTHDEWLEVFEADADWHDASDAIETGAREFLAAQGPHTLLVAAGVMKGIWPTYKSAPPAIKTKAFRRLRICSSHGLQPYCRPGTPSSFMGRETTPMIYFNPAHQKETAK